MTASSEKICTYNEDVLWNADAFWNGSCSDVCTYNSNALWNADAFWNGNCEEENVIVPTVPPADIISILGMGNRSTRSIPYVIKQKNNEYLITIVVEDFKLSRSTHPGITRKVTNKYKKYKFEPVIRLEEMNHEEIEIMYEFKSEYMPSEKNSQKYLKFKAEMVPKKSYDDFNFIAKYVRKKRDI